MVKVYSFSKARNKKANEDCFGNNSNTFVIADGSTDKSGKTYDHKTGGQLVSQLIVATCLQCNLSGIKLVKNLNDKVALLYKQYGISSLISNPLYRFTSSFICVRILNSKVIITYLGDSGFRINGDFVYREIKKVDIHNATVRSKYIKKTGDINGSRNHIMPLLLKQFSYQNNSQHSFGYGVIDGTKTPAKYVKTFEYDLNKIKSIELFTDGYFDVPSVVSIKAWEQMYCKIEKLDPDKWKKYQSTKSSDDRTIMIVRF